MPLVKNRLPAGQTRRTFTVSMINGAENMNGLESMAKGRDKRKESKGKKPKDKTPVPKS
jgi:hypothetical protein